MTLIKSISGIRGTIGGTYGNGLTPLDIVKYTSAYGQWILQQSDKNKVVVGRDARVSGSWVNKIVCATLQSLGINVVDIGLSTTPTVEMATVWEAAAGGIIITASHNPAQWNALKLLNQDGEFLSEKDGLELLDIAESGEINYAANNKTGTYSESEVYFQKHIAAILQLPMVDVAAIKNRNFVIAIDAVNSTGGIVVPMLLKALGVNQFTCFYGEPNGLFPHNPEPVPENLGHISNEVSHGKFDLGIVVDPDVDRLCFVNEDGSMFGEEYTLVAVADYVLQHKKGNTVSNLSSTRALRDVTEKHGGKYFAAAVGEVNVVTAMKANNAVIGGEGNGGVILPELHYGRDALVGIALFLSHLAKFGKSISRLRAEYPNYYISKNKIELTPETDMDLIFKSIKEKYKKQPINDIDGLKIEFDKEWVHLRKSNTEPIIRIYSESETLSTADHLAQKLIMDIKEIINP